MYHISSKQAKFIVSILILPCRRIQCGCARCLRGLQCTWRLPAAVLLSLCACWLCSPTTWTSGRLLPLLPLLLTPVRSVFRTSASCVMGHALLLVVLSDCGDSPGSCHYCFPQSDECAVQCVHLDTTLSALQCLVVTQLGLARWFPPHAYPYCVLQHSEPVLHSMAKVLLRQR